MPWAASLAVAPAPPSLPPRAAVPAHGRASQRRWEMTGAEHVWLDAGITIADAPVRVRRKPRATPDAVNFDELAEMADATI